jgi:hypothetical protein
LSTYPKVVKCIYKEHLNDDFITIDKIYIAFKEDCLGDHYNNEKYYCILDNTNTYGFFYKNRFEEV